MVQVGDDMPDFTVPVQSGEAVTLSERWSAAPRLRI
jgi:peroxiredoxin